MTPTIQGAGRLAGHGRLRASLHARPARLREQARPGHRLLRRPTATTPACCRPHRTSSTTTRPTATSTRSRPRPAVRPAARLRPRAVHPLPGRLDPGQRRLSESRPITRSSAAARSTGDCDPDDLPPGPMRRIVGILVVLAALTAVFVTGVGADDGDGGSYEVRAIFDNAGFLVEGEEVRIAGAKVGHDLRRRRDRPATRPRSRTAAPDPGKAVVVLNIDDPAFQDFREDASCLIRPQSLIGEKFVECEPDPAAGAEHRAAAGADADPRRRAGRGPVPAAARAQRQGGRPRPGQQHHARALSGPLPADPQRPRRRLRGPRRGPGRDHRPRRTRRCARPTRCSRSSPARTRRWRQLARDSDTVLAPLAAQREHLGSFINQSEVAAQATAERRADLEETFRRFPSFLRELRSTMIEARSLLDARRRRSSADLRRGGALAHPAQRGAGPVLRAPARPRSPASATPPRPAAPTSSPPTRSSARSAALAKSGAAGDDEPQEAAGEPAQDRRLQEARPSSSSTSRARSTPSTSTATSCASLLPANNCVSYVVDRRERLRRELRPLDHRLGAGDGEGQAQLQARAAVRAAPPRATPPGRPPTRSRTSRSRRANRPRRRPTRVTASRPTPAPRRPRRCPSRAATAPPRPARPRTCGPPATCSTS